MQEEKLRFHVFRLISSNFKWLGVHAKSLKGGKNVILGYTAFFIGPCEQISVYMWLAWCNESGKQQIFISVFTGRRFKRMLGKITFSAKLQNVCKVVLKTQDDIIWAASSEFRTSRLCEQRRFRRACASAQSRQNLRCSPIQAVSQEEPSDRKPDPYPLWMAGHAQLKFVMTECSKTQIRSTGLIFYELLIQVDIFPDWKRTFDDQNVVSWFYTGTLLQNKIGNSAKLSIVQTGTWTFIHDKMEVTYSI